MRKALIGILMAATMATPLWAEPGEDGGRVARQNESSDDSPRPQRAERQAARVERQAARVERQQAPQPQPQPQAQAQARQSWQGRRGGGDGQSWRGRSEAGQQVQSQQQVQPQQQVQTSQSWQGRRGGTGQSWRGRGDSGLQAQSQQQGQTQTYQGRGTWQGRGGGNEAYRQRVEETREASRRSAMDGTPELQRQAAQNQARSERRLRDQSRDGRSGWSRDGRRTDGNWNGDGRSNRHSWNRSWRNDSRYDWQRYRYSNRNIFRIGPYYAPYRNYSYNRLSIGLFLGSAFFGQNYWIDDPWYYRLPPAEYGTHWVRYYNDVVLVDDYTGEVLDVIYDFFW
jgi:hypothetical protein